MISGAKKKSLCVVCATPLTLHLFFRQHVAALSREFDVTIIYNRKIDTYVDISDLCVRHFFLPLQRKIMPINDFICLLLLIKHFIFNRYDLIWAIAPKAGLLAVAAGWLTQIPNRLFIFQGEVWATERGLKRLLLKAIDRLIAKMASHVLSVSEGEKQYLIQQGIINSRRIKALEPGSICGVDVNRFQRQNDIRLTMRKSLGFRKNDNVCLFLGRLRRDKGLLDLAKAFSNARDQDCRNLKLLIVGPDEDKIVKDILEMLSPYSNDVIIRPFTENPLPYLSASDIFCLPSYREGFPISILEASSCALPVIATSIYGNQNAIVDGITGYMFPSGDILRLTELLVDFCNNKDRFERMGVRGREWVSQYFRSESVIGGYQTYIKSILN